MIWVIFIGALAFITWGMPWIIQKWPHRAKKPTPPPALFSNERDRTKPVKLLLEEGKYDLALGLKRTPSYKEVKEKIRELYETLPDLDSTLVKKAQDSLLNFRQYRLDRAIQEKVCLRIVEKWGETALEVLPEPQIWRMVQERHFVNEDFDTFLINQVTTIFNILPALDMTKGSDLTAEIVKMDCPQCHGGKETPPCKACGGTGKMPPVDQCPHCRGTGLIDSPVKISEPEIAFGKMVCPHCHGGGRLDFTRTLGRSDYFRPLCSICHGTGKHCACSQEVEFHIPGDAKPGMIIKGKNKSGDNPCYVRLTK